MNDRLHCVGVCVPGCVYLSGSVYLSVSRYLCSKESFETVCVCVWLCVFVCVCDSSVCQKVLLCLCAQHPIVCEF